MKLGSSRYIDPAMGSFANGLQKPMRLPRVAISWPPDLLERMRLEAAAENLPFAEIVRRRVRASYWLKPLVRHAND